METTPTVAPRKHHSRGSDQRWFRHTHRQADRLTEAILYGMVVFSPWAFGTTQPWAIKLMNLGGFLMGGLLLMKWTIRQVSDYQPARWDRSSSPRTGSPGSEAQTEVPVATVGEAAAPEPTSPDSGSAIAPPVTTVAEDSAGWAGRVFIRSLGVMTVLLLLFSFISAWNARAKYLPSELRFDYFNCWEWLPHSLDATQTWDALRNYLALAAVFWATRDWLLVKSRRDCAREGSRRLQEGYQRGWLLPERLRRLLWVVSVNGAALAVEGLVQRALGSNRLLFLVVPWINNTADAQFGPYAYRSNGAQYLLLAWPLALGLWWTLRRWHRYVASTKKGPTHNHLLPCILIMAAAPLFTISRGGALIGAFSVVAALALIFVSDGGDSNKSTLGVLGLLVGTLFLGGFVEWRELTKRVDQNVRTHQFDSGRLEIWTNTWQIAQEHPQFGTGPGTFGTIYGAFRQADTNYWYAQAHNDYLETLATFGRVGSLILVLTLGLVFARAAAGGGIAAPSLLIRLVGLGLVNCLLFAAVDFPLQVYSILFLFILECAIITSLGAASRPVDAPAVTPA